MSNPTDKDNVLHIVQTNPAMLLLAQLERGRVATELAEKYPQVVAAVRATGKKGELTLRLTMKPDGKGEVTTVEITSEVKAKLPEKDRKPSTFFIEPDTNRLTRQDPNQVEIQFPATPKAVAAN